jgi:hypothetical protein
MKDIMSEISAIEFNGYDSSFEIIPHRSAANADALKFHEALDSSKIGVRAMTRLYF